MTTTETPDGIEAQVGALADRLFGGGIAAMEALTIYVGTQLGLYKLLAAKGPLTAGEVAHGAGIAERYAREWCEQQSVAELIEVDDPTAPAEARRYSISDAQAAVLVDETSLAYLAPAG